MAVCLPRSPALVVALLAVLEAGGAYVPLDPAYPAERLGLMLADSGARVLLTQAELTGRLPAPQARVVLLDPAGETREPPAAASSGPAPGADNLAYLIYTSGSTGTPKGVALTHRSAVAMVRWAQQVWSPEELSGVLFATSVCFDLSVFELFVPLSSGGRVIVADNALALPTLPAAGEVTLVNTVPSAMAELVREGGVPASVRTVNLAGEALQRPLVAALYALPQVARVWNLYGPSEDTTYSTFALQARSAQRAPGIGRPIAGTRAHVLDRGLRPAPLGVPGELYLGGAGLARGYFGRPELTAERFVPDPDPGPEHAGERLYRTGDLVRCREDGELDFLGRIDHQVKVRGFRIELGEIEAALAAVWAGAEGSGVAEVAVLVREDRPGDPRLVAYLAAGDPAPSPAALRTALRARLPEYMVPGAFVVLPRLPLSPNGKVDRRALSRLAPQASEGPEVASAAPRTPAEEMMAGIWADVLGREQVGVDDSFFALGGHSLLATRLVSRIRETFGVELALKAVFEAPTVAGLAGLAERALAAGLGTTAPPLVPLPKSSRTGPLPLSFAQERLWFLDQLEPGSAAYNMPVALRLDGVLDLPALAASLDAIVRRHEALRTTFRAGAEGPEQGIAPEPELPLPVPVVDLDALPTALGEETARRLLATEAAHPFDLARGPLLRALLLRLAPASHRLIVNLHHIVSDGWSLGVLVRELGEGYGARAAGRAPLLPELPVQYADYAVWQRGWLADDELARQLAWWRERLAGAPEAIELPADRPRPPVQGLRGSSLPLALPPALGDGVSGLGRSAGATVFMVLLAAFQALLSRLSGQARVVVGSPVANRTHREVEGLIGFFVNTLPLPADLASDPPVAALLAQVRETTLGAYAHQDVPFEKLVAELAPERSLAHSPLFQVMLILQNAPLPKLALPGLAAEPLSFASGMEKFDLTLTLAEAAEGGLAGALSYSTDRFERATGERFLGWFSALLGGAVSEPGRTISALPLLAETEREQLLAWGTGAALAPAAVCLHELVAAQAARTPAAEALIAGNERLTYGDLQVRASRLAAVLRGLGVGPEERVGVCLTRSPALVVALLAVLEAGGAYVPLDPNYPAERLSLMLGDSGARVLLTQTELTERLAGSAGSAGSDLQTVLLDGAGHPLESWEPMSPISEGPAPGADNLAYLIYTSGSTGKPKGVALTHRSAVAMVRWAREVWSPAELSGVLFATSVCFDLSVFELFVPLSTGGRVILADHALALPSLPAAGEVTLVNTVPSAMAELVREGGVPASVRTVNLAGEALQRPLVAALYGLPQIERVWNLYGPSEDTTYSTFSLQTRSSETSPAIGRPIAGTRAEVLDRWLRPSPLGVPGELFLGGAGLARGYFGRPELTAERFVPAPAGPAGERLYRTGDRTRFRPDGELEFLGRIDHQVKVRGFRIELGEIEAALAAHPAVEAAAVLARLAQADRPGDLRLVAYVVPRENSPAEDLPDRLRASLAERLPAYMVPAVFVTLPELPLSPNGKVDRKALPAPEWSAGPSQVAPRTALEAVLAGIWCEVLGIDRVGIEDSFFRARRALAPRHPAGVAGAQNLPGGSPPAPALRDPHDRGARRDGRGGRGPAGAEREDRPGPAAAQGALGRPSTRGGRAAGAAGSRRLAPGGGTRAAVHPDPFPAGERGVGGGDHGGRGQGVLGAPLGLAEAAGGTDEALVQGPERLSPVVAGGERGPLRRPRGPAAAALPADLDRPLAAMNRQVDLAARGVPRQVDPGRHAVANPRLDLHRLLDRQLLLARPLSRVHPLDRSEEEAQEVGGVRAVVGQHPAPGDPRVGIPVALHIHLLGEGDLRPLRIAEAPREEQLPGEDDPGDEAVLAGEDEPASGALGGAGHRRPLAGIERERLLAEDMHSLAEQIAGDGRMVAGRGADDGGLRPLPSDHLLGARVGGAAGIEREGAGRLPTRVGDGDQARLAAPFEGVGVDPRDPPGAHQGDAQGGAHGRTISSRGTFISGVAVYQGRRGR